MKARSLAADKQVKLWLQPGADDQKVLETHY